MIKFVFSKKEDKKGIFKHPRRTNYFLPKRRTCPPKRGRVVTLVMRPSQHSRAQNLEVAIAPSFSLRALTTSEEIVFVNFDEKEVAINVNHFYIKSQIDHFNTGHNN